jgi:hypothetical protein
LPDESRRAFLAAAGAAALALGPGAGVAGALDRKKGIDEPGALTALLTAELHAAYAYERSGDRRLAEQEDAHARALASLLDALGRPIPLAPASPEQLQPSAKALLESGGARAAAIALERALIEGCARGIAKLGDPSMIRTVATIMASHAQHLTLHTGFHEPLARVPYPPS